MNFIDYKFREANGYSRNLIRVNQPNPCFIVLQATEYSQYEKYVETYQLVSL